MSEQVIRIAMTFDTNNYRSAAVDIKNFCRSVIGLFEDRRWVELKMQDVHSTLDNNHFHVVFFDLTVKDRTKFNIFKLKNPVGYEELKEHQALAEWGDRLIPSFEHNKLTEEILLHHLIELL